MNKGNIRFDSKVIILSNIDPTLFGKLCHIARKERSKYERGVKV